VEFGLAARLLLRNLVSLQDMHSNILNSKQGFVGTVWFCSNTFIEKSFNARLSFKKIEFETRILLAEFGLAATLLLRKVLLRNQTVPRIALFRIQNV